MVKATLRLYGNVQGVFLRRDTKRMADELKLKGHAKNIEDGSVEVEIIGPKSKVDELVEYCTHGCENGYVENIDIEYNDDDDVIFDDEGFSILG